MYEMAADEDIIDVLYRCRSEGKDICLDSLSNNFFKEQQVQRERVRKQLARHQARQQKPLSLYARDVQAYRNMSNKRTNSLLTSAASCTDISTPTGSGIQAFHSQVVSSIPVDVIPRVDISRLSHCTLAQAFP